MLDHRWFAAFIHAFAIISLVFIFSGCAKQQTRTADVGSTPDVKQEVTEKKSLPETQAGQTEKKQELQPSVAEKEMAVEKKEEAAAKESDKKIILKTQYIVKKGDCLWWISKYKDVYNDSFLWSVIYEANKDKIKNANLIYPGQKLVIPRKGYTMEKIKMLRKKSGASKPYLPPKQANFLVD